MSNRLPAPHAARSVAFTIDGRSVDLPDGATILDGCKALGIDTPTLCWAENLTPVNACRVCVVEVEGSRTLVPSCARRAEAGMVVHTDSARVRTSRKVVLELLGPNFRPVQVTEDLPGFWERLYPEVKKDLKRRYPRHEWR